MQDSELVTVMAVLVAAYPNQTIRPETVELYKSALSDLDFNEALEASQRIIRTSRFFPTVAEVRSTLARTKLGAPTAAEAWETVERLMTTCHWWQHRGWEVQPDYGHDLVERAVGAMGGLLEMQRSTNQGVMRGQFMRIYAEMLDTTTVEMAVGQPTIEGRETRQIESEEEG